MEGEHDGMTSTHWRVWFFALVLISGMAAGCSKAPELELQAAQTALSDAKSAEAETYARKELDGAADSLASAKAEVERQNGKFVLFRNYKLAAQEFAVAQTLAIAAKDAAVANKEKARVEAEALYAQLSAAMDSVRALAERAPRDKEGRKVMESITADITVVSESLPEVRAAIDKQDYLGAQQTAKAFLQRAESLRAELQAAVDKRASFKAAGAGR